MLGNNSCCFSDPVNYYGELHSVQAFFFLFQTQQFCSKQPSLSLFLFPSSSFSFLFLVLLFASALPSSSSFGGALKPFGLEERKEGV